MQILKEIIKQSNYKPSGGLKGELYRLVEADYSTEDVKDHFTKTGKIKQLRTLQTNLRESLLDSVLTTPLYSLPNLVRTRFKVWKKQLQSKILLQLNSKKAGIKVAIDTIPIAEKKEEFEVVFMLCRELINQFSNSQFDALKYRKYLAKMEIAQRLMLEEIKAEKIYRELCYYYNSKKSFDKFNEDLITLEQLAKNNGKYKFNYYYYSAKGLYYQQKGESDKLIQNNRSAYNFFKSYPIKLHYAIQFNFISELIPYYLVNKDFARAGNVINMCIDAPPKGSYNWHKILLYKGILGLYSNKPQIALGAFKSARSTPKKFDGEIISQHWHLIEGYLAFYYNINNLNLNYKFKLSKWLNITEKKGNKPQKANLIIVELIHHLANKNFAKFNERTEQIERQIAKHFKGHEFKRTRYFLRMLKAVVKGNYHPKLTSAHAANNLKKLQTTANDLDVERIERELVDYEVLWGEVLGVLGDRGK